MLTPSRQIPLEKAEVEGTFCARWSRVVEQLPAQPALRGEDTYTFRELDTVSKGLANEILRVSRGERGCVALLVPQNESMVIGAVAVLLSGQALLGLHPGQPDQVIQDVVQDAKPVVLLCHPDLLTRATALNLDCPVIGLLPTPGESSPDAPQVQPSDPCVIFYTSGSTGKPKGVVKSHRAVLHRVWLGAHHDQIGPGDRASLLTHLSFASAEADVFATLLLGGCVCPFDVAAGGLSALKDWLLSERISLFHPPVVLFREFLRALPENFRFPDVRLVALAGDLVLPEDLELWKNHFPDPCEVRHRYSSTETALITVAHFSSTDSALHCGAPVQDKAVEIRGDGEHQSADGVGEILVRSRFLASGYWNRPAESRSAFHREPASDVVLYRTGDLGYFDESGHLHYVGRADDQVKVRGFRLNCREVESALLRMPEVKEAVVVVDRSGREPELVARIHMENGQKPCLQSLRKGLQQTLPDWKIPTRITAEESLPKTLTGKIDRGSLVPTAAPRLTVLKELEQLWLSFDRPPVSAQDDLLLFGGDSITVVLLLHEIEQKFQVEITPRQFFERRTLDHLASLILQSKPDRPEPPPEPSPKPGQENWTVADGFLSLLSQFEVKYLFLNPGTDSAPLLESVVKFRQTNRTAPTVALCLHESVAMGCAHGYFMVSGQTQMVFVHVDLGTLNVGGNLHNAQRGRAGIVLVAGRSPYTLEGQAASRDRYAHWVQEQRDQSGAVRNYVKWDYTLPCGENLVPALEKAFQAAGSIPEGPVYLTLPREVFMSSLGCEPQRTRSTVRSRKAPDPELVRRIADRILSAKFPLLIASRSGSNPETVRALVEVCEAGAIGVIESRHRLNFPHTHPQHLGFSPNKFLNDADFLLSLDHEVPWIPRQWNPGDDCCVVQVD
ncbi:MAG: AMP-binding protein, partial [Candidatus Eremiobacteraeota bacterium]|nr:AMP-binding protein [Candidatus Eremiobacteraeota bacterium]